MPVLDRVFPHLHGRLTKGWERTLKDSGKLGATTANTREDDSAANEEIINDRLLRELTTEYLILLRTTQEKAEGRSCSLNVDCPYVYDEANMNERASHLALSRLASEVCCSQRAIIL